MTEYRTYYRGYLEGYENTELLASGAVLGIRESRRIKCDYTMCMDDYFNQASFDDEIGRYNYPVDLHAASLDEQFNSKFPGIYEKGYPKGKSYGISYRSLLPIGTNNLLVAGRCIGADREMMGSLRVMPCCFITGMAAGVAAYLASKNGIAPRDINTDELRAILKSQGAFLG